MNSNQEHSKAKHPLHESLVISASRRTDLVSCYPDYLIEKLKEYPPEKVHTIVIWTKNPANMIAPGLLNKCLAAYRQLYVHLTITGLGGSILEPHIPEWQSVAGMIPEILALVECPERISWRFDPIVSAEACGTTISNFDLFPLLAARIQHYKITSCRTSWVEPYKKVLRRLEKKGLRINISSPEERAAQAGKLKEIAAAHGMNIHFCSIDGLPSSQCIDGSLLGKHHPDKAECSVKKARGQRKLCGCTESRDIGWYSLKCRNGCLYCYAEPLTE